MNRALKHASSPRNSKTNSKIMSSSPVDENCTKAEMNASSCCANAAKCQLFPHVERGGFGDKKQSSLNCQQETIECYYAYS